MGQLVIVTLLSGLSWQGLVFTLLALTNSTAACFMRSPIIGCLGGFIILISYCTVREVIKELLNDLQKHGKERAAPY